MVVNELVLDELVVNEFKTHYCPDHEPLSRVKCENKKFLTSQYSFFLRATSCCGTRKLV